MIIYGQDFDICCGRSGHCRTFCHVEKFYMWRNIRVSCFESTNCVKYPDQTINLCSLCLILCVNISAMPNKWIMSFTLFSVISVFMQFLLFCCKIIFVAIYAVLSRFVHFLCGDKLSQKCPLWRKNDKYHVWHFACANSFVFYPCWNKRSASGARTSNIFWSWSWMTLLQNWFEFHLEWILRG